MFESDLNESLIQGFRVKFILMGDNKVGKTTIANRYINHKETKEYKPTIGLEVFKTIKKHKGKKYILKIEDSSGNEQFINEIKNSCENANFIVFIFDITKKETFLSISKWLEKCDLSYNEDIILILIGNKKDLANDREISKEEIDQFAKGNNMKYYEISAFNDKEVKNIFDEECKNFIDKFNKDLAQTTVLTDVGSSYYGEFLDENKHKSCC